jgi:hypothetical protein
MATTTKATTILDRTVDECLQKYAEIAHRLVCTNDADQHEILRFELDVLHSSVSCYLDTLRNNKTAGDSGLMGRLSSQEIV